MTTLVLPYLQRELDPRPDWQQSLQDLAGWIVPRFARTELLALAYLQGLLSSVERKIGSFLCLAMLT